MFVDLPYMLIYSFISLTVYCLFGTFTASAIQAAPKRAKVAVRTKENSKKDLILGDLGMKRVPVQPVHGSHSAVGDEVSVEYKAYVFLILHSRSTARAQIDHVQCTLSHRVLYTCF